MLKVTKSSPLLSYLLFDITYYTNIYNIGLCVYGVSQTTNTNILVTYLLSKNSNTPVVLKTVKVKKKKNRLSTVKDHPIYLIKDILLCDCVDYKLNT